MRRQPGTDPTPTPRRTWLAALRAASTVVVLAVLLAACGGAAPPVDRDPTPEPTPDPTPQTRLRPIASDCEAMAPDAMCHVSIALEGERASWAGVAFELSTPGYEAVAVAPTATTAACLVEAGPAAVALVCPSPFTAPTSIATVTLRRTDAPAGPLAIAGGALLPYAGGRVAVPGAVLAAP